MNFPCAYEKLLGLYPRDYRALFAREMRTAFEVGAEEQRRQGWAIYIRFGLTELSGLALGAGLEWIAKLTTDSSIRGRYLPDRLKMRPPGVPWERHYAAAGVSNGQGALPHEVREAQKRTEFLVSRMVHAISHHDFPGARRYSDEERMARENLRRLHEKYQIDPATGA